MKHSHGSLISFLLSLFLLSMSGNALAVPSFARQTTLACSSCHTVFPELTPFGRTFKLNGYTLTGIKQVESTASDSTKDLKVNVIPPLSTMLQVNATSSESSSPNVNVNLPGEFSLFMAGEISPKMGSFIQLTMEQGGSFGMDNTDIRFANRSGKATYGITVNNNPTVQDLWNSTPAWGYPWTGGASITQPLVADGLGQNVMGLGGYAQWDNGLYTELTLYRETNGFDAPDGGVAGTARIQDMAPYARVAWQKGLSNNDMLMVGAYGLQASLYDGASVVPGNDKYNDFAIDTQYEHHLAGGNSISVHAAYTNEQRDLVMSAGGSPTLNALRIDGTYHWGSRSEASLAYANNTGNGGGYDDEAITAQYSYLPWQNTKLTAQYTHYTKLGGVTGSAASKNDTAMIQAWLMW